MFFGRLFGLLAGCVFIEHRFGPRGFRCAVTDWGLPTSSVTTVHQPQQDQLGAHEMPVHCLIPRLHDDGTARNGSAWHGTERLSSNVYTRLWLCGIEWFFYSNSVINYNRCQKSKWMPCLQCSVQSRKGGIRCTKGERLYFLVFLVTYTILWQWPSNTPQMASVPILLYTN